jgi:hypothetical protein
VKSFIISTLHIYLWGDKDKDDVILMGGGARNAYNILILEPQANRLLRNLDAGERKKNGPQKIRF